MADYKVEVVVAIPTGSRNEYEYDHARHVVRIRSRLFSATSYPADHGFIPDTLAEDGDPLDAFVVVDNPTFPGSHVIARPAVLSWMTGEKGPDAKVICVPLNGPRSDDVSDLDDLSLNLRAESEQFFAIYNDPKPGKATHARGYEGRSVAFGEISASRERFGEAAPVRQRGERL